MNLNPEPESEPRNPMMTHLEIQESDGVYVLGDDVEDAVQNVVQLLAVLEGDVRV